MEPVILCAVVVPTVIGWFKYRKQLHALEKSTHVQPTSLKKRLDRE